METWRKCISKSISNVKYEYLGGISIAIPGPFDYDKGVSLMSGLQKYESLYGVNVKQYLCHAFDLSSHQIKFINDASSFGLGEFFYGAAKGSLRAVFLTIGTGFGSAFVENGQIISSGNRVPQYGWVYHVPFKNGRAEDYFSQKWIIEQYKNITGIEVSGVKRIKEINPSFLETILIEFADNLIEFLSPWLQSFEADCLVIGGNIVKFNDELLLPRLKAKLEDINIKIDIKKAELFENGALLGSAANFSKSDALPDNGIFRLTKQPLLPIQKKVCDSAKYDMYPIFNCDSAKILSGYDSLVDIVVDKKHVIIDGYVGVMFNHLQEELNLRLSKRSKSVIWKQFDTSMKSSSEINKLLEPYLGGNDPLFGKRCELDLIDFVDQNSITKLKTVEPEFDLNIIIGIGSILARNKNSFIIYVDVPKNEIQYRSRANKIVNLGDIQVKSYKEAYKRFYFVDWPVLNCHKRFIIDKIDIYIDDQRIRNPLWIEGNNLRKILTELSTSVFRVRPWFEAGTWGGQWLKNNIPLINKEEVNYAWSFELIAPENGIIISDVERHMLEISFDLLIYYEQHSLLGKFAAEKFGFEFPIRFDFLDTFDGGNLSIQCHAGREYMHENFGENLPQDETYYIVDAKEGSKVYLGFNQDVDEEEFKNAVEISEINCVPLDVNRYIQSHESKKHDFFLIPHGTIHGSGKNNLVLEISATPYIQTFKIYDWLRPDLDGKPRTLNIKRAFENLDFTRQGNLVKNTHINVSNLLDSGEDWSIFNLQTNEKHYYYVNRIEFQTKIHQETHDRFHLLMLVEGEAITIQTENGYKQKFYFAETLIIPAGAKSYKITNDSKLTAKILKAFLK